MKRFLSLMLAVLLFIPFLEFSTVQANGKGMTQSNLSGNGETIVQVGLNGLDNVDKIELNGEYNIVTNESGKDEETLSSGIYTLSRTNKGVSLKRGSKEYSNNKISLIPVEYSLNNTIKVGTYRYLGEITFDGSKITNKLPLEHYLYGVVPYEIGNGSPMEALKAQSIVARNFALNNKSLDNTVSSQVYRGFNSNHSRSIEAVNATKGEILVINEKVATVYYSSSNGGFVKSPTNIWGGSSNYEHLIFREDQYDSKLTGANSNPHKSWSFKIEKCVDDPDEYENKVFLNNLKAEIAKSEGLKDVSNIVIDCVQELDISSMDKNILSDDRLMTKIVVNYKLDENGSGSGEGYKTFEFNERTYKLYMDKFFGKTGSYPTLRSPSVLKVEESDDYYLIEGSGFGHGVGMSQHGARNMAHLGMGYDEILFHYFPNTEIVKTKNEGNGGSDDESNIGDNDDSNDKDKEEEVEEGGSNNDGKGSNESENDENENNENDGDSEKELDGNDEGDDSEKGSKDDTKDDEVTEEEESSLDKKEYVLYSVVYGDTLWSISQKFKTSVKQLIQLNDLKSDLIIVGQKLKVGEKKDIDTKPEKPKDNDLGNKNDKGQDSGNGKKESIKTYKVKKGDTLWALSRKYSLSVDEIKRINGLKSNTIYPGQNLKLQVEPGSSNDSNNDKSKESNNKTEKTIVKEHVVKKGDSLWSLSRKYSISIDRIKKINNLKSNLIIVGQKLKVSDTSLKSKTYIVDKGDTLWGISQKVNVSVSYLMNKNGLNNSVILIGQALKY